MLPICIHVVILGIKKGSIAAGNRVKASFPAIITLAVAILYICMYGCVFGGFVWRQGSGRSMPCSSHLSDRAEVRVLDLHRAEIRSGVTRVVPYMGISISGLDSSKEVKARNSAAM